MKRKSVVLVLVLFFSTGAYSQDFFTYSDSLNKKRLVLVAGTESTLYVGSLIGLNELWYKNYPRTHFHTFNDNKEWMQLDKAGHIVSSYYVGRIGTDLLRWSGVKEKNAIWIGGMLGMTYLLNIEILDAYSSEWGFSWGDMAANTLGASLVIGQELLWQQQHISLKYSFSRTSFPQYRPTILGQGFSEELFKDYNGHTYWLSFSPASFMKKDAKFPKWLNVALGYGATGMLGGMKNPLQNEQGEMLPLIERSRQYYLSFDIDLTQIPVKSNALKFIFKTIGFIKFPSPTLELSRRKLVVKPLFF